jgi:hypothetical protein
MPADGSLEARLRRLEDCEEIRQLLLEYARHLDAGDYAAYSELFTSDGELVAQLGSARSPAGIRALLEEKLGAAQAAGRLAFHMIGSAAIAVDGDRATSKVMWCYMTRDDAGYPWIPQLGHYHDQLVRDDGRWKFARREITRDLGFSPLTS